MDPENIQAYIRPPKKYIEIWWNSLAQDIAIEKVQSKY